LAILDLKAFLAKFLQNIHHFKKFQNLFSVFWQIFFDNFIFIGPFYI
jgi:hypothetical protein